MKPTTLAMRAADKVIPYDHCPAYTLEERAEIIDRVTRLPELMEALEVLKSVVRTMESWPENRMSILTDLPAARAAIAKAT